MANLATIYRPNIFEDVIGQDNTVSILQNQLSTGNIKHAYLFVGPAGDGKTTCARIMAKELNGSTKGIVEIDAASNNGVENIRMVIESVKFKPMDTPYKVYVLDECHMFSIGAWNALLKTLEETPEHAVFILCTTDPQKIPATILSRCQRFDFKKVSTEAIAKRLRFIVDSENETIVETHCGSRDAIADIEWAIKEGIPVIQCDNEVLEYIAKLANGGVRDAISMLDTCLGYKSELTLTDIEGILGTSNYKIMFELLFAIAKSDEITILTIIESLFSEGRDLKQFINQFIAFIIECKKYQVLNNFEYVQISKLYENELKEVCKIGNVDAIDLLKLYEVMTDISYVIKYEANIKPIIEGKILLCLK